jgi:hypothetical protein
MDLNVGSILFFITLEIDSLEQLGKLAKAVKEEGDDSEYYTEVFAWGSNHAGQMGLGSNSSGN